MNAAHRPARTMRHEAIFMLLVFAIPVVVAAIIPYNAFSFVPAERSLEEKTSFAFVTLAAEDERAVLAAVRSAWHAGSSESMARRADLSMDLPPIAGEMRVSPRTARVIPALKANINLPPLLPPTSGAGKPIEIHADSVEQVQSEFFSKEELMALPEIKGGIR